jgi:hypothetical protein
MSQAQASATPQRSFWTLPDFEWNDLYNDLHSKFWPCSGPNQPPLSVEGYLPLEEPPLLLCFVGTTAPDDG